MFFINTLHSRKNKRSKIRDIRLPGIAAPLNKQKFWINLVRNLNLYQLIKILRNSCRLKFQFYLDLLICFNITLLRRKSKHLIPGPVLQPLRKILKHEIQLKIRDIRNSERFLHKISKQNGTSIQKLIFWLQFHLRSDSFSP